MHCICYSSQVIVVFLSDVMCIDSCTGVSNCVHCPALSIPAFCWFQICEVFVVKINN